MAINVQIPDNFLLPAEKEKLMTLLGAGNDETFAEALGRIALSALDEYKEMFLGMGMPSRGSEVREYRLYHLIKRFFNGRIPDELEVSQMFQLPESKSKNLILYVLTRFRYDVEGEILDTLRQIIKEAEIIGDGIEYHVFIGSQNMVEELNRVIAMASIKFKRLSKIHSESNMYSIAPDSYATICKYLGIKR